MGEDAHLWTLWRFLLKQEQMQETMAAGGGMWLVQTDDISHAADGENLFCLSVELAVYPDTSSARTAKVLKLQATLRIDAFSNDKGEWGWWTAWSAEFPGDYKLHCVCYTTIFCRWVHLHKFSLASVKLTTWFCFIFNPNHFWLHVGGTQGLRRWHMSSF